MSHLHIVKTSVKMLALGAAALFASSAYAVPLSASQILSQFNVIVKDKLTSRADIEGRVVANEITGGATFYNGSNHAASSYAAITANKIDHFSANLNNHGTVNYKASDAASFSGGGAATQTPAFNLNDFTAPLDALSDQLSGLTANSFVNSHDMNSFLFVETPGSNGTAVFDLSTALLSTARNIQFSGNASTIIINVSGTGFNDTANFNANDFLNTHIIWNFEDATSLSFQGWHGTVLAGDANVTNSSAMEGALYAKNFTGNGELHDRGFAGALPPTRGLEDTPPRGPVNVPEPATYALFLGSLLTMALMMRRRKAKTGAESRIKSRTR